ncbi:penicillin acylase family protein [Parahaliea mediterranea]|uniref:penicillin acylase family protein n=1 Tax=Parahaliea mediterranea TaxID=651086 RepID=UPI001300670F|nr:penicillin acylase family protein [Parahaliea mediterranea]
MTSENRWKFSFKSILLGIYVISLSCSAQHEQFEIRRDSYGVPHVYAANIVSLYFGFGYAIAQDRLFQLEMAKRTGNGSIAEVLGSEYLITDIATRRSISPQSIESQLEELPHDARAMFKGYAAGINKRVREVLSDKERLLPRQFAEYDFEPTFWTESDVVMIGVGLIFNRFFGNSMEVDNLTLLTQLQREKGDKNGREIYAQLRWKEDPHAPTIIPGEADRGAEKKSMEPSRRWLFNLFRQKAQRRSGGRKSHLAALSPRITCPPLAARGLSGQQRTLAGARYFTTLPSRDSVTRASSMGLDCMVSVTI